MNAKRRRRYQEDHGYRDRVATASRDSYKKKKQVMQRTPMPKSWTPSPREVVCEGLDPITIECFTIPEAAVALGKTKQTLRRWIMDGLVPPPKFVDTLYGHAQYTADEILTIRGCVDAHSRTYDYLHTSHTETINRIWQGVEAYHKEGQYE